MKRWSENQRSVLERALKVEQDKGVFRSAAFWGFVPLSHESCEIQFPTCGSLWVATQAVASKNEVITSHIVESLRSEMSAQQQAGQASPSL